MSRRKDRHAAKERASQSPGQTPSETPASDRPPDAEAGDREGQPVVDGEWTDRTKIVSRSFPGPAAADAPLRVAFDRSAYADVVLHAKESLDAEICGVLVGDFCEDDSGKFVHVRAAIRGAAAREGATHVTFTQETWNAIHKELEEKYPKLAIVGWYHSHPGFGVEFSEMDLFIQKNFFSGPAQVGMVTDPLGGEEALCFNGADGVVHLDRFWIDGRERRCRAADRGSGPAEGAAAATATGRDEALERLETRVSQLVQAIDQQQASFHRFLLFVGMSVAIGVTIWIGSSIYRGMFASNLEPPKIRSFAPVPIQVGDKAVLLGIGVVEWQVPPELNAVYVQLEEKRRAEEAAARAAQEAEAQAGGEDASKQSSGKGP